MLANLDFVRAAENVIFLGPSGVGKTHLAISLGHLAVEAGYNARFTTAQELADSLYASLADGNFKRELERYGKCDLLIIDELGFLSLDKTASNHFFQVINQAYERQAVIVTSNRPFQEIPCVCLQPSSRDSTFGQCFRCCFAEKRQETALVIR
jgi:DNA replication protein DnaC